MLTIRKATIDDVPAISGIYEEIHDKEAAGVTTTGWRRGLYPTAETAEESVGRDDMFVQEDQEGNVVGTAIINRNQVDCYSLGDWEYPAADDEVMVIHTLVISDKDGRRGSGHAFLEFYEDYAREHGCHFLRLDTNARNAAARAFYEKHGYKEIGIVPTVFNGIPGVDLVLIEKHLEDL